MKRFSKYSLLLKNVIFLILIGQFCANTIGYDHWIEDSKAESFELHNLGDSESGEEDSKKEKDSKLRTRINTTMFDMSVSGIKISIIPDFQSIHYSEITTPPPE